VASERRTDIFRMEKKKTYVVSYKKAYHRKTKTQKLIRKNEKLTEAKKMVKRNGKVFL
jgi:hypothetical protein